MCCAAVFGCCLTVMLSVLPRTTDGVYNVNNEGEKEFSMPLRTTTGDNADVVIRFNLKRTSFSPSIYRIIPDDCLESLSINGQPVTDPSMPFCDFVEGRTMNLETYLSSGTNTIEAFVRNSGGDAQFSMRAVWNDSTLPIAAIVAALSLLIAALILLSQMRTAPWKMSVFVIFFLAVVVRVYYVSITPYWIRGHDTDGHIEYIDHMANEWSLPSPDQGWESWQPPLYYAVSAVWTAPLRFMDSSRETILFSLQILSLLFSVWTLWIIWKIGRALFVTDREGSIAIPALFALIAFIPSLVFLSARINNDVLMVPLAFLSMLYLQRWWNSDKLRHWLLCVLAIALCILSKSNGLLLLPVAFGALLVRRRISLKGIRDAVLGLLIVAIVAGWFSAWRALHETSQDQDMIVGNTGALNSGLAVNNDIEAFTTFSPAAMVRIPYNNPWTDESRRQHFWEYLYRSAFFGEFDFGPNRMLLASWLVAWSLPVFILSLVGFFLGLFQWKRWAPMILLAVVFPLGHAVFRWEYPYGSSQDFRYILPILLAASAFAALTLLRLKQPLIKSAATLSVHVFAVLCAMFLLHS